MNVLQISNGVNVSVVELFPLGSGLPGLRTLGPPFGEVRLPGGGAVRRGAVSDDACAARPCLHDAPCTTTWNDYQCACPRGYKGKQCAEVEFCQLQGCPLNSHCRNLDQGSVDTHFVLPTAGQASSPLRNRVECRVAD